MKTRGAKKDLSPPKIKPRKNHHKSHKPNNSNKIIKRSDSDHWLIGKYFILIGKVINYWNSNILCIQVLFFIYFYLTKIKINTFQLL